MAYSKSSFSTSMNNFTFDVYKQILSEKSSENAFMSTSSMMAVLNMLYLGAQNDTHKQIKQVLRLENIDDKTFFKGLHEIIDILKGGCRNLTLRTASKIYPNVQKHIIPEYLELVREIFKADIKCLDFTTKPEESRSEINGWVEEETNGKIKDLLSPGSVSPITRMIVVNAIYFKGQWNEQFSESITQKADFYVTKAHKIQVDMMGKTFDKVKYTESETYGCKALELPYIGKEQGMVVLLPNDIEGLSTLENHLSNSMLNDILKLMNVKKITVNLPKFKMEYSYEMKDVLMSLGMRDVFDANRADLSNIGEGLFVSQVIHKAFVDVNEEGTEAAAATAMVMAPTCVLPTMFLANHPFLFMIWDHRIQAPLFIGRLVDPRRLNE
ncbi:serpin B6-like [Mercenaria mercenaria]|uniref:serpin B6-like n=1 Tax=Mercenaria mercenaria TaxID=6596 RepID=UPI00234F977D|nr:serpin B6-like [Mercenaria mercenaria]